MNPLFQIDIPRRSQLCANKGERFASGMEIYSMLFEGESEAKMARRDYCSDCWSSLRSQEGEKQSGRGFWKSKIEKPKINETSTRSERALALLRQLMEDQNSHLEEIFVLCLFLSHGRHLALRQEFKKEEKTYFLYEILRKEEFLTIQTVNLTHFEIEKVQKSIAFQLQEDHSLLSEK